MTDCAPHRDFLAAIADGETEFVPTATLAHVETCTYCTRDIEAHRLLTSRLRQAGSRLVDGTMLRRPVPLRSVRSRGVATAIAAAVVLAVAGPTWFLVSRPDPVQAAVSASSGPVQFQSTDPSQVGDWCLNASGRTLPAIQLDGMQIVGARMDRMAPTDIVTVVYTAPSGARVTVSWLEGEALPGTGVEDKQVAGREVLVVHSAVGTAVITGSSRDAMWETAAAIESA